MLKKGGEKLSDAQVEEKLENIVQLFSYLNDKDLFSDIYRNLLAKRLLNQKSANDDAEKSMIGKLKLKCGAQFTSKVSVTYTIAVERLEETTANIFNQITTKLQPNYNQQLSTTIIEDGRNVERLDDRKRSC